MGPTGNLKSTPRSMFKTKPAANTADNTVNQRIIATNAITTVATPAAIFSPALPLLQRLQ